MSPGKSARTWRVSLFTLIVAAIFWLGASSSRVIIGNSLLQTGTLEFEEYLAPDAEREIFRLLSITSLLAISSYVGVLISSIVFLITKPFPLKEHGWLMMSAILFYLFVPVEIFTMYLDARMIHLEFFTTAERGAFRELFIARVAALSGTPLIAMLCYYTVIGLAVFQPFRKLKQA
jgi:hypothetical protein